MIFFLKGRKKKLYSVKAAETNYDNNVFNCLYFFQCMLGRLGEKKRDTLDTIMDCMHFFLSHYPSLRLSQSCRGEKKRCLNVLSLFFFSNYFSGCFAVFRQPLSESPYLSLCQPQFFPFGFNVFAFFWILWWCILVYEVQYLRDWYFWFRMFIHEFTSCFLL